MQVRRHQGPPFLQTIGGRRLVKQTTIITAGFVIGYLLTVFWLFPAPLLSAGHMVPRVLDRELGEAREKLEKQGFRPRTGEEQPHPRAPKGTVIWQDPPPGVVLPQGSPVQLTTSSGPAPVPVPDVMGLELPLARKVVEAGGLLVGEVDSIPASADRGVVVATRPSSGVARDPGFAVDLVVSNGPAEISVPDVIGMTLQPARLRLEQAGLKVGGVTWRTAANKPEGMVIEQRPAPGTLSPGGGRVDLILSRKRNS